MDDVWIVVRTVPHLHEALVLRSILAGHGIESQVAAWHVMGMYGIAPGGVPVLVREHDLTRAADLLETGPEPNGEER